MVNNIDEILDKYTNSVIKNLNRDNMNKIIEFLSKKNCDFIETIIEDYLDLFTIDFLEFQKKYESLNKKYNNKYLSLVSEDMNYLEEMFY